jgi:hypothetical protein
MTENKRILLENGFTLSEKQPPDNSNTIPVEVFQKGCVYIGIAKENYETFTIHTTECIPVGAFWFEGSELLKYLLDSNSI